MTGTEKGERILIVDDEDIVRKLLRQKLSSEGYQCHEAGSAEQTLQWLKSNPIELVVLDIKMPGKSGAELLPEIKAGYPDTSVVMATALTDTRVAIQCMKQGAYDYLTKPFDLNEVVLSVDRALEKRRLELENRKHRQHLEELVEERTAQLKAANEELRQEVAERKQAEETLVAYKLMVESAQDAIFLKDLDSRYVAANAKTLEAFELPREEVIGKNDHELMPNEEEARINIEDDQGVFQTGKPTEITKHMTGAGGKECWFSAIKAPYFDTEGKVIGLIGIARDITERKRAEEALRQSEERYRTILDEMEDGYFELDLAGNLSFFNDSYCRVMGYSREELMGIDYRVLVAEEDIETVQRTYNQVYTTGQPARSFSFQVVPKDGARGFAEISVFPLRNQQGEVIGFRGIGRDITEHKQAEEALRASEEKYRELAENINEVIYAIDENGVIGYVSPAVTPLTGYDPSDLIGQPFTKLIHPEERQKALDDYQRIASGHVGITEYRVLTKSGDTRWMRTSSRPLFKADSVVGMRGVMMDITERKKIEETLRQSEERYRTILEEMYDGYFQVDLAGNFTFFNDSACRHLGYSRDEMMGMNYRAYIDKEYVETVYEAFNRVYRTGKPIEGFSWQAFRKDGKRLFLENSISLLRDRKGETIGFRGVIRDVTERKQAEEALRQSEERYRTILEQMGDTYYEFDVAGNFTFVNDSSCRSSGYSREELIGMNYRVWMEEQDVDTVYKTMNRVYRTGKPAKGLHWTFVRKDGSRWFTEVAAFPVRNQQGEIIGFRGISRDITERKEAEELTQALMQSAGTGIYIIQDGKFQYVNALFQELTGRTDEELIGTYSLDLVHPEDRDVVRKKAIENLKGQSSYPYEYRYVKKNGETIWVLERVGPVEHRGKPAAIGSFMDITERKQAEEERKRLLDDLAAKTKELEQVIYVTSHDLRSPLVNIQGFTKELDHALEQVRSIVNGGEVSSEVKEKLAPVVDEDIPDAFGYILKSTAKIDSLLSGLLQLSRTGRTELAIEHLDMNRLASDVASTFGFQANEAGATLEVKQLPACLGDERQINQVFSNLVGNALKYLDSNRPGVIRVSGRRENGQAVYCVEDNGIGIPQEHKEKVFEIFHRLDPGFKSGDGLGLTIIQRILERHGGNIWVESQFGKGSKFFVTLPASKEHASGVK